MTQGPRTQLPVNPEREVEGESDQAQQGQRKVPELWLYGAGVTGLFAKIRNWEAGMNWRRNCRSRRVWEDQCRCHWPAATTTLTLGVCPVPLGSVVSVAEAGDPTPCVLPAVLSLLPSHPHLCTLWAHRAHMTPGWASVSRTEWV